MNPIKLYFRKLDKTFKKTIVVTPEMREELCKIYDKEVHNLEVKLSELQEENKRLLEANSKLLGTFYNSDEDGDY